MATKRIIKAILVNSLGFSTRVNNDLVGNIVALRPLRKELLLKATTFTVSEKTLEKRFAEARREVIIEASLDAIRDNLIKYGIEGTMCLDKFKEDLSKLACRSVDYKHEVLETTLSNFTKEVKPQPLCQTVDVSTYANIIARLFDIV